MIIAEHPEIQTFGVIVHDHQGLIGGVLDNRGREHVLGEMIFPQRPGIVGRVIGNITIHHVRFWFGKVDKSIFKFGDAEHGRAMGNRPNNIQEEPKTGSQGDGPEQQNYKLLPAQADQFNITGK